jgi:hypothetical protein
VATKFRDEHNASSIVFVDDGQEASLPVCEKTVFDAHLKLRDRKVKSAEEAGSDDLEEEVNRDALTLYQCSDEGGTYKVTEIKSGPLEQNDLKSEVSLRVLV